MIKKLLILPLLGVLSFGAFASADFTSDSDIIDISSDCSIISSKYIDCSSYHFPQGDLDNFYIGVVVSPSNSCSIDNGGSFSDYGIYHGVENSKFSHMVVCQNNVSSYSVYFSTSPLSWSSSSSDDEEESSSSIIPGIPSSFTSGLTSMVSNFGGTLINWFPSIILVALGITAIFALFRVVRGYARGVFRG